MNFHLRLLRTHLREVDISSKIQLTIIETQNLKKMESRKLNKI